MQPRPDQRDLTYLGDGVYGWHDGYQIWIATSDGISLGPAIAIDYGTFVSLRDFARRLFGSEL